MHIPRNLICRKICAEFEHKIFTPEESESGYITIHVDELEALRLCDLENMEQEEASKRMEVSRGTFQRILYSARHKSAEALCEGKGVLIEGGNYEVTEGPCKCGLRCKRCKHILRKDNLSI